MGDSRPGPDSASGWLRGYFERAIGTQLRSVRDCHCFCFADNDCLTFAFLLIVSAFIHLSPVLTLLVATKLDTYPFLHTLYVFSLLVSYAFAAGRSTLALHHSLSPGCTIAFPHEATRQACSPIIRDALLIDADCACHSSNAS